MRKYSINQKLETIGGFWRTELPEEIISGTFSARKGRIELLASPSVESLNPQRIRDAILAFNSDEEPENISAIFANTKEGQCTLLNVHEMPGAGVTDFVTGVEIIANRWRAQNVVMGLHLPSAKADVIEGAAFYLSKIHNWLPTPWTFETTSENVIYTSPIEAVQAFSFGSLTLQADIICEVFSGGNVRPKKGAQIRNVPRIRVVPRTPKSLNWFQSLSPRLENFFSLMLGSSISLKALQLFVEGEDGWVISEMARHDNKVDTQSWVRCAGNKASEALAAWLAVPDEQRPVERTLLGSIRKSSLFVETEFLGLAQALEGFGRIRFNGSLIPKDEFGTRLSTMKADLIGKWGDSEFTQRCIDNLSYANDATYGQRIRDTTALLSPQFASKLQGDPGKFVQQIVQTRNYFTHLGIKRGSAVVDETKQLFLLNQRIHAFLRCVMLIDLGINETEIEEPILYQARRWR